MFVASFIEIAPLRTEITRHAKHQWYVNRRPKRRPENRRWRRKMFRGNGYFTMAMTLSSPQTPNDLPLRKHGFASECSGRTLQ